MTENNQVVTVRVKPKQFEHLTEHSFEYWGASIIGKLGPITERGFELLNPGIQVYEKKPKAGQVPNNPASKVKGKLTDGIHFG